MHNKKVHMVAFALVIVGALNWLLVGALNMDLVALLLGAGTTAAKAVYILIGLAAVYEVIGHKGRCADCK